MIGPAPDVGPRVEFAARGTLAGSAFWLVSSNLLYALFQWATVVALARVGVTSLGQFGVALAVTTPVVMLTGFALRAYQATDVVERYAFVDYLALRVVANLVAAALLAGIALATLDAATTAILVPLAVAKIAEATSETCYGLAQRQDRMAFVAWSKVVRGGLGLAAMVVVVALGGTVAEGMWALAGVWTVFLFAVDLLVARGLEPLLRWPRWTSVRDLAVESAPLGAVTGAHAFTQSLPRYLLELTHGTAAVGYFTAFVSIVPALSQLGAAVGHAAAPRLGWAAAGDLPRYRALVRQLVAASAITTIALAVGAIAVGRPFLLIAYGSEYAAYQGTFVLLMLAAGLGVLNTLTTFAFIAVHRLGLQLGIQCLGLVVTGLAGALLIPTLSVPGAALALAAGGAAMAAVSLHLLAKGVAKP
jgi:O-antigen/teichoic acid export membrane protein